MRGPVLFALASLLGGCGGGATSKIFDGGSDAAIDATVADANLGQCASDFGAALTNAFGRLDGTLVAIVEPANPMCAIINGTHLVLQVSVGGDAYRMVVNVLSDRTSDPDPQVRMLVAGNALIGDAWSAGWHPTMLDYVTHLQVSSDAFTTYSQADLIQTVESYLEIGSPISVYATSTGGNSAHLIHRNLANQDGAIVIDPMSDKPRYLLFHFDDQTF